MNFETLMKECPLVAILRGILPEEVEAVCDVLYKNGIRLLEIPLNSPDALRSIEIAVKHTAGRMFVGAGTVLTTEQVEQAALRREYIDAVLGNLSTQLDHTYVVDQEGHKRKLEKKGE